MVPGRINCPATPGRTVQRRARATRRSRWSSPRRWSRQWAPRPPAEDVAGAPSPPDRCEVGSERRRSAVADLGHLVELRGRLARCRHGRLPAVGAGRPDDLAETQLEELVVDVDGGGVLVDRPGEQPRDLQPERPDVTDVARLVARASFQGPGAAPAEWAAGECRRHGQPAVRGTFCRFIPCEFVGGPTGGRWPSHTPRSMRTRLGCRGSADTDTVRPTTDVMSFSVVRRPYISSISAVKGILLGQLNPRTGRVHHPVPG